MLVLGNEQEVQAEKFRLSFFFRRLVVEMWQISEVNVGLSEGVESICPAKHMWDICLIYLH